MNAFGPNVRRSVTRHVAGGVSVALAASVLSFAGASAVPGRSGAKPEVPATRSAPVSGVAARSKAPKDTTRKAAKKRIKSATFPKPGGSQTLPLGRSWREAKQSGVAVRSPKAAPGADADVVVVGRTDPKETGAGVVYEIAPDTSAGSQPQDSGPQDSEPQDSDSQKSESQGSSAPGPGASPSPTTQKAPSSAPSVTPPSSPDDPQVERPESSEPHDIEVRVSYADFAAAYGGDWSSRLSLQLVESCTSGQDDLVSCTKQTPLESQNDAEAQSVSATIPAKAFAAGEAARFALVASGSGDQGDFTATPLSLASSWSAGTQSGSFSWSYPLDTPSGINGPEPDLALGYSSGSVDGRTSASNNQTSWIGEGFSLDVGFVEREYAACRDDKSGSNAPDDAGDLCWKGEALTLSMGGSSSRMLRVGSTNQWRSQDDDGSKIEHLTGADNGARGGEYWRVTTTDGTRYYFGKSERFASDAHPTDSVSTVPVYGNQSGEPCHASSFAASRCTQAWRWGLDYVVDPHGNTMSYFYDQERNHYGANKNSTSVAYDRSAVLTRIEYGTRAGQENTGSAPVRVDFATAERCIESGSTDCDDLTSATADDWPDVPFDQICSSSSSCANRWSPTFFSRKRLTGVTTKTWDAAGQAYEPVDAWTLQQSFPGAGDGTDASLWLKQVQHTGKVGTDVTLPPVKFYGQQFQNRVDETGDGVAPFIKWRLTGIDNGTGGLTSINYTPKDCTASNKPSASSLDQNTRRCFPSYYQPNGAADPQLEFFHKYLVSQVVETDRTGQAPDLVTSYVYSGAPAWHYDESVIRPVKYRTWNDWRGYARVSTRVGGASAPKTNTETLFLRGMDGDRTDAGGTRHVTVTDSDSPDIVDKASLNGFQRRTTTTLGPGGADVDITVNTPWISDATASSGSQQAHLVDVGDQTTKTRLSDGSYRTARVTTSFDAHGQPTQVEDLGDTSIADDNQCTHTDYATNPGAWMWSYTSQEVTTAGTCAATPAGADDVIAADRTSYDNGSFGEAPTKGDVTRSDSADGWDDGIHYQKDATSTFDAYGRALSVSDALGAETTTSYAPATGLATTITTTNALDQTSSQQLDPARGSVLHAVNERGTTTDYTYDGLGRVTAAWAPGRDKSAGESATYTYAYTVSASEPTVVRTNVLRKNGVYLSSYEFFDGLMRPRGTQTRAAGDAGGRLVTEKRYDSHGWLVSDRGPFYNTAGPSGTLVTAADNQTPAYTNTDYDQAGRATKTTFMSMGNQKWHTTTSYGGDRVSTTPPVGGTATTTVSDVRGQTTKLLQYHGPTPSGPADTTSYTYTPAGDLATVTNPAGSTWSYDYDIRGRKIASDDPDRGATHTTYDRLDRPVSTTDARDITLWSDYDVLGRKVALREDDASGPVRASWLYDTVKAGLLTSSTRHTSAGDYVSSITSYDDADRPLKTKLMLPPSEGALYRASGYVTSQTYITNGSIATQLLPSMPGLPPERLRWGYDDVGNVRNFSGFHAIVPLQLYSPYGQILQRTLGSQLGKSIYDTRDYEAGTRRLTRHTVSLQGSATTNHLDLRYAYDDAGNVTGVDDIAASGPSRRECYDHDYLRRMTTAYTTPVTGQAGSCPAPSASALGTVDPSWDAYTYDASGNRTKVVSTTGPGESTTATSTYPDPNDPRPHALSQVATTGSGPEAGTESFGYDAVGNTTTRTGGDTDQQISWDAEGHQESVTDTDTGQVTSYVYDAGGNRLIRRTGDSSTLFVGPAQLTADPDGTLSAIRNYELGGEPVATRVHGGIELVVGDQHGTPLVRVGENSLDLTQRRFTPFGQPRADTSWPSDRGFVNRDTDTSTGTTHLGAREYDPSLGRFLSVDPIGDPTDPQQLNGYAYANNNPATMTDPDGRRTTCGSGCGGDWRSPNTYAYNYNGTKRHGARPGNSHYTGHAGTYRGAHHQAKSSGGIRSWARGVAHKVGGAVRGLAASADPHKYLINKVSALAASIVTATWNQTAVPLFNNCIRAANAQSCRSSLNLATLSLGSWALPGGLLAKGALRPVTSTLERQLAATTTRTAAKTESGVVRHYTTREAAESISKSGSINPGASGKTWLTPDQYATGAEARAKLALNKTPDGYFEIPMCRVSCPSAPSRVQPYYGQPGGGVEITTGSPIDIRGLMFRGFN